MSGTVLGFVAFAGAFATGFLWFRRMRSVSLPENRGGFVAALALCALLGIVALSLSPGWLGGVPAGLAVLAGGLFLLTVTIGGQKGGSGGFQLGQPVPELSAPDENGEPFELSSLSGRPLLLKFFRGHW